MFELKKKKNGKLKKLFIHYIKCIDTSVGKDLFIFSEYINHASFPI